MKHTEFLEAARQVLQPRGDEYGDMSRNFTRIASIASMILKRDFQPHEIAMIMHVVKLSRIAQNPSHIDSYVDGINYLSFAGELATQEAEPAKAAEEF